MKTATRPKRVCSPRYAVIKARKGIELNQWELEDLAKDREYSIAYAELKGSFPEAEEMFLQHILHGNHWHKQLRYFLDYDFKTDKQKVGEILLKADLTPGVLVQFAEKVIKGRWPEAEKKILSDSHAALEYQKDVMKCRWEKLENKILFLKPRKWINFAGRWSKRSSAFSDYLKVTGPHPEIEKKLKKVDNAKLIRIYATNAVGGHLPRELHQKMMLLSFDNSKKSASTKNYLKFIALRENMVLKYLSSMPEDERKQLLEKVT